MKKQAQHSPEDRLSSCCPPNPCRHSYRGESDAWLRRTTGFKRP